MLRPWGILEIQRRQWLVALFGTWLVTLASGPAQAQLTVVIDIAPHRIVTPAFRTEVRDQLGAGLKAALGGIDEVAIVDAHDEKNPINATLRDFHWRELTHFEQCKDPRRGKTHFVTIEFDGRRFRVRSRQFDGSIGWSSPVVRDETTADREFVGRLALEQVLRDYGMVARITASDSDRTATCRVSAGNVSDDLLRQWIRLGDVFAVIRESKTGRGYTVPHTYLVVTKEPTGGMIECRVESRFVKPLSGWETGQFAAVRLGTGRGPARLRAISTTGSALPELHVRLSATGTDKADAVKERGAMRYGRFVSTENFDRLGFARLLIGDRMIAQVPVPIIGNEPTVVEVNTDPAGEATALADSDLRHLNNRVRDLLARADLDNDQLKKLLFERKNRQALGLLIITLRRMDEEVPLIAGEVANWRSKSTPATKSTIDELMRSMRDLQAHEQSLKKTKMDLEASLGGGGGDDKLTSLRALVAKAERDEQDADYDSAIATYEQAIKQAGDWPEVARKLEELKKAWAPKSDAHRAARKFIYDTWAKAQSFEDIEKNLDSARRAFEACKQVDDRMAPRKIYLVLRRSTGLIVRRDEELRKSDAEEAVKQMESLRKLRTGLVNLMNDVENYLRGSKQP